MKRISIQKIFNFISFIFILSCCIFYGTRFIKLYLKNKETENIEANSLVKVIRENNTESDNFKEINGYEYFINNSDNNYLLYSNILWRIIKINDDNSITVISDQNLTYLAYGEYSTYDNSQIKKWLNTTDEDYTGILEKNLNKIDTYLQKTTTCLDIVDEVSNQECQKSNVHNYISLLSTTDYTNIGNKESFIINGTNFYLNNTNSENKVWYITDEGKLSTNNGTDIIGIRPVITIKSNIDYLDGNGSKEKPYTIEKENGLFGGYVKLGNDIWRIYQVNETEVRLMLNDYLKINNSNLTYQYSKKNSYYDDYVSTSIAYYLNRTYLNSLSYKDKIKEVYWPNGIYSKDDYNYINSLNKEINTKVALLSIGNIFLNNELSNYHTMTQSESNGNYIYTIQSNKVYTKQIYQEINVIPTISIEKELLTKGNGTIDSPYEME